MVAPPAPAITLLPLTSKDGLTVEEKKLLSSMTSDASVVLLIVPPGILVRKTSVPLR